MRPPPPPPQTADPHHQDPSIPYLFYHQPPHFHWPPPPLNWAAPPLHFYPPNFPPPHQNQFPPPQPNPNFHPPSPHPQSQAQQGYSQEWNNSNWGHHQAYPGTAHSYGSTLFPTILNQETQFHVQSAISAPGGSNLVNQPFGYGSQFASFQPYPNYQPLNFAHTFYPSHYSHVVELGRGIDSVALMRQSIAAMIRSIHTWPPQIPPLLPSGLQHDASISAPFPVPVHLSPTFQPTVPSAGTPYGLGAVPSYTYGVSDVPKPPKKRRTERNKKKAVNASSSQEHLREENGEEGVDKDHVEAARTAAINSKIENLLTEVISKVTDELYDEIATRVVNEDDQMVNVDKDSQSLTEVPTLKKASAEVTIPSQAKETETVSIKINSTSPEDVLGLTHYASGQEDEKYTRNASIQGKSSESRKRKLQF